MIPTLIRALRVGASVQNQKGMKWTGIVAAIAIVVLNVAKAKGVFVDVGETEFVNLAILSVESILAIIAAYSQIASTEKVGLLPAADRDPRIDERLRDQPVPTGADAAEKRNRDTGFPDGPFFDS